MYAPRDKAGGRNTKPPRLARKEFTRFEVQGRLTQPRKENEMFRNVLDRVARDKK